MDLEEIDGIEVVYGEEDERGRRSVTFLVQAAASVSRIHPSSPGHQQTRDPVPAPGTTGEEEEWVPLADLEAAAAYDHSDTNEAVEDYRSNLEQSKTLTFDASPFQDDELPAFSEFALHTSLKRAVSRLGFAEPTEIQAQTWRSLLTVDKEGRDVVGVAETGSGKTLAYGLPVLQHILSRPALPTENRDLTALILVPTRELAMQVSTHLCDVVRAACTTADEKDDKRRLPINIVTLTGGMSVQKQKRMMSTSGGPDIIVATPGRLAELAQQDHALAKSIRRTRFLILDEADRMIEQGHYAELDEIVKLTARPKTHEEDYQDDFAHAPDALASIDAREDLRTLVFSATMSKELQRNLKRSSRRLLLKATDGQKGKLGALSDLLIKLDFRDPDPFMIDLTPEGGLVSQLTDCKIDCMNKDKDVHLYYFLLRYPGRTLVFLSSIDAIRRLHPLLSVLGLEPGIIHSGLQQRARLKSLEKFRSNETGLLLATDVAARGLDIPEIRHVVHYQLPRSADVYVHRSGRTARAGRQGLSLALCSPEEKSLHRSILKSLERSTEPDDIPVDHAILDQLARRVAIAVQIDKEQHRVTKTNNDEKWLRDAANAMEVDMSEISESENESKKIGKGKSRAARKAAAGLERLKAELRQELARPLRTKGISSKYLTSFSGGSAGLADSLIDHSNHDVLLGVKRGTAVADLSLRAGKKARR